MFTHGIQVMHLLYFRVSVHISSMVFQIQTENSLPSTWVYRKNQWINCKWSDKLFTIMNTLILLTLKKGFISSTFPNVQWGFLCGWQRLLSLSNIMLVAQSCPTFCNTMGCSLLGSSVHGVFQARILEWVAMPFSKGSSWPRDQTEVSCVAGRFFTIWTTWEASIWNMLINKAHKSPTLVEGTFQLRYIN